MYLYIQVSQQKVTVQLVQLDVGWANVHVQELVAQRVALKRSSSEGTPIYGDSSPAISSSVWDN